MDKKWYCAECKKLVADDELDTYECDSDGYPQSIHKACGYPVD